MTVTAWLVTVLCVVPAACRAPESDVLATWRGGELRTAQFDADVRTLPEAERLAPPEAEVGEWLEGLVRRSAMRRILRTSEAAESYLEQPQTERRRRWLVIGQLADMVAAELAAGAEVDTEELAARLSEVDEEPVDGDELLNFRHLFLRLDRAETEAERRAIRDRGHELTRLAAAGEDFAELARSHSQSRNAATGGLVENQRARLLEVTAREALANLREGEVSSLIETPTGLHIFQLERRLSVPAADREQRRRAVRARLNRQSVAGDRRSLLEEIRQRTVVATESFPWRVGSWVVNEDEAAEIAALSGPAGAEKGKEAVVERLLLAEEGLRRGFRSSELDRRIEEVLLRQSIGIAQQQGVAEIVAALPQEELRPLYDARPSAFATQETAHLEIIFVPRGEQPFTTQQRLEDRVAELRDGADFGELARRISTGPAAAAGGDLGPLPPSDWASLHPQIYRTVVAMDAGEISDPVFCTGRILSQGSLRLRNGFAIVKVREKQPPRQRTFEEALDDVRTAYAQRHVAELVQRLESKLLDEAGFEILRLPETDEFLEAPTD